jgi:hypothetical protein
MKRRETHHSQLNLFAPKTPPTLTAMSERRKLLPLVSALLSETVNIVVVTEVNDEDHS